MSLLGMLNQTCTIQFNTAATQSARGSVTAKWTANATGVPCKIETTGGRSTTQTYGEEIDYDAVGYFLPGAELKPVGQAESQARITAVKNRRTGVADTDNFEVLRVVQNETQVRGTQRALLRRVG